MTTSDTPETDAAVISSNGQWSFVLKETCRRIERERDEACQVQNGLAKQVEQLRKERDQLKEALLIMENLLKPGIELFPEIGEILKQGGAK